MWLYKLLATARALSQKLVVIRILVCAIVIPVTSGFPVHNLLFSVVYPLRHYHSIVRFKKLKFKET